MKTFHSAVLAALLAGAFFPSFAADDMGKGPGKGMDMMKAMDTNNDGMISKEEFMKFHEARYDGMKKNKSGQVDMKDMPMMRGPMMPDPMKGAQPKPGSAEEKMKKDSKGG